MYPCCRFYLSLLWCFQVCAPSGSSGRLSYFRAFNLYKSMCIYTYTDAYPYLSLSLSLSLLLFICIRGVAHTYFYVVQNGFLHQSKQERKLSTTCCMTQVQGPFEISERGRLHWNEESALGMSDKKMSKKGEITVGMRRGRWQWVKRGWVKTERLH